MFEKRHPRESEDPVNRVNEDDPRFRKDRVLAFARMKLFVRNINCVTNYLYKESMS